MAETLGAQKCDYAVNLLITRQYTSKQDDKNLTLVIPKINK